MTTIYWVRRDLRLADNPAIAAACARGAVVPVFICDEVVDGHGAAPKWRLGLGVEAFARALKAVGSKLILRRGAALPALRTVIADASADAVYWNRLYDPESRARDESVKAALKADGIEAKSFQAHVLFEPWTVETKTGGYYKVYTPFWKMVRDRSPGDALPAPRVTAPAAWPVSDDIGEWSLGHGMNRGADVVAPHLNVGEAAAQARLDAFIDGGINDYADARDNLAKNGTSLLSENLAYGEISARTCWHAGQGAMRDGKPGAETFLKEVVWRDFAYHLVHHTPHITTRNWREEWEAFPWNTDPNTPEVLAWKQGRTGMAVVDAAMREMYVTGRMHNRARMLVASYLTKHLMTDWKIGMDWFEECLVDWDPASNAMGWQWSAGSGPDATPYFRVFNPETQAEKFDKAGRYRMRWLAEITAKPLDTAASYFDAIPRAWDLSPTMGYPMQPIVSAADGRKRALEIYANRGF